MVKAKLYEEHLTEPSLTPAELARIDVPTLVMIGDHDEVKIEHAVELYRALPDARLAIVPGTSHGLLVEKPELCNAMLARLLQLTGQPSRGGPGSSPSTPPPEGKDPYAALPHHPRKASRPRRRRGHARRHRRDRRRAGAAEPARRLAPGCSAAVEPDHAHLRAEPDEHRQDRELAHGDQLGAFQQLPGADTQVVVPDGQTRCVKVLLTAETACEITDAADFCYVRALVDGVPMDPNGAGFQTMVSEDGTAESGAYEWIKRVGEGPHTSASSGACRQRDPLLVGRLDLRRLAVPVDGAPASGPMTTRGRTRA